MTTAEEFARRAHAGQVDKAGLPYTGHLMRVAARARAHAEALGWSEDAALAYEVGWLHDTIEDTETTAEDLRAAGFGALTVAAVKRLTRTGDVPYLDGIRRLITNGDAMAMVVKLADNEDNLDLSRPSTCQLSMSQQRRYTESRKMLMAALGIAHPGGGR